MSKKKQSIAIVGAGMGGVLLAIMLQRNGHRCTVFEQAPALAKIGAGINVGPNSTRIFRELGLEQKMLAAGVQPRQKYSREWDTGKFTFTVQVPELRDRYNGPFLAFHRGALQEVLCTALNEGTIQFGKCLVGLTQTDDDVQLKFDDGTEINADFVVGADGVHSKVREALFGVCPPDYHGLVSYRSLISTTALRGMHVDDNTKWWAPDRYVLTYFTTEARDELNLITGSPEAWTKVDLQPIVGDQAEMLMAFKGFHPDVQRVLEAASSILKWPMLERKPFTPWSKGRVVLMGDACHPTTPHMGQGAGMSFEDAVVLSRCFDEMQQHKHTDVFHSFERTRFDRTGRIQLESHENKWTKSGMDSDWVYGYDAFTTPLK